MLGREINDIQLSENFNLREFQCREGGAVRIDPELVRKLQLLRDKVKKPVYILSGYRTPEYNAKVNGVKNSYHTLGKAADIKVEGIKPEELAKIAESVGFDGIGIYPTFVHVDTRGFLARWRE